MITLVCVALYLLIGWRAALHAYFRVERSDRQFRRDSHAQYPMLYPTQEARDRDEQEWVDKMASYRYSAAAGAFVFWPLVAAGLTLKALFDASLARHRQASLSRSRVRGG